MQDSRPLKILMAAAELTPLAKAGGLGDVCAALGAYLHNVGHDVRILLPFYSSIDTRDLAVYPVDFLQDMRISLGRHSFNCAIYATEVPKTGLPVYLLRCPALYYRAGVYTGGGDEHLRFILLTRMAFEMCQRMGWSPDILHCNDWHTALLPIYQRTLYAWDELFSSSKSLLSIHNIGYQGTVDAAAIDDMGLADKHALFDQQDVAAGRVNFLRTGILHADVLSTVSPTYAREIQTSEYGMGLEALLRSRSSSLVGILNGVDYGEWDPRDDPLIPRQYGPENLAGKEENKRLLMEEMGLEYKRTSPLFGFIARLTAQKGLDLLEVVLPEMLSHRDFSLVALGSGEGRYKRFFIHLQEQFPGRVCFFSGYNNKLAHQIEAGSDVFLMPSAYEPCGLNQMYSLKYGTIPIVRSTGGLADSVQLYDPSTGEGTGIVFRDFDRDGLRWAVDAALTLYQDKGTWQRMIQNAMAMNFSWEKQGAKYEKLYRVMLGLP